MDCTAEIISLAICASLSMSGPASQLGSLHTTGVFLLMFPTL